MRFAYSARDPMGRVVEGELEAASQEQVVRELKGRALTPRWIRTVADAGRRESTISAPIPSKRDEPVDLEPVEMGEVDGDDEAVATNRRSGCSPWSLFFFLIFLFQVLRAC